MLKTATVRQLNALECCNTKHDCTTGRAPNADNIATITVTSPQLFDVWTDVVGPMLSAADIVALSRVNQWGRRIAHSIKVHNGLVKIPSVDNPTSVCQHMARHWPFLSYALTVEDWKQNNVPSPTPTPTSRPTILPPSSPIGPNQAVEQPCPLIRAAALQLRCCHVSNFDVIDTQKLREFGFFGPRSQLSSEGRDSLEKMLGSCSNLASLDLTCCVSADDHDITWFAWVLESLPQLVHLNISGNSMATAVRAQQVMDALCGASRVTTLNLSYCSLDSSSMNHICQCITHMPSLSRMHLEWNQISEGCTQLSETLVSNQQHVTWLDLSWNWLGYESTHNSVAMLSRISSLTYLNLAGNRLNYTQRDEIRKWLPNIRLLSL